MFKFVLHIKYISIFFLLILISNLCTANSFPELIIPDYTSQNISSSKTNTEKSNKTAHNNSPEEKNNEDVIDSLVNDIGFKFNEPEELIDPNLKTEITDFDKKPEIHKQLTAELYKHPLYSGSGFFKIKLSLDKKMNDESNANNIVFVIDTSASCSSMQLAEIKEGIYNSLLKLNNSKNKFNIIEFKEKPNLLFSKYMPINNNTIEKAKEFLAECSNSGYSNILTPLSQILQTVNKENNKSNSLIYLITDGTINSTSIKETSNFIKAIRDVNKNATLITYSNSKTANSIVLKLLAKTNHGICFISKVLDKSNIELENLITKTCNSNLKNISYKISGNVAGFTHPISLSYILQNNSFDILGYYKENVKKINLKVSIHYENNKIQDFYFILDISNAKQTTEDLEKKWGEQFVLHLYSNLINHYSKELFDKIQTVSIKFELNTSGY